MTERHELEPLVHEWLHQTLDTIPDPTHRYGLAAAEVNETKQQRAWLSRFDTGGLTVLSATKFMAAAAIVALFGGFLLVGVLTPPQGDEVAPAAVTETPTLMASEQTQSLEFPTGTFVAAEWSDRFLEFNDDGTCRWTHPKDRQVRVCTYVVDGDLFTEATYEWEAPKQYPPATYRWEYDGEHLSFELVGDDASSWRRATYQEQPYRYVPDPRMAVIAAFDIEAGTTLLAGHTELRVIPSAEAPVDTLAVKDSATGATTTVVITKGQPITPDMLEPPLG